MGKLQNASALFVMLALVMLHYGGLNVSAQGFGSQHPSNFGRPRGTWGQPPFGRHPPFGPHPPFGQHPPFGPHPPFGQHPTFGKHHPRGPHPPFGSFPPFGSNPGFGTHNAKLVQANAPPSYTKFPGVGAYKFHPYGSTWHNALTVCQQEGAKMLIVNSAAEAEAIKTLFKSNRHSPGALNSNHVWVGAQEKGVHGTFITNDGVNLAQSGYLVWSQSPPQPNDPGTGDCVSFYVTGVLYDDACHLMYPFVCEF